DVRGCSTSAVADRVRACAAPLHEGEHKYALDFARKKCVLYRHSYLRYGLMRARANMHRILGFMARSR
ncbi:hypothetical protein DFH09DRAFT_860050, partial [Mycena vulgaris]